MSEAVPERPAQHVSEDRSRAALKTLFAELGWVCVDISPDYGEDFLVYVYNGGVFSGQILLLQLKAVSRSMKGGWISCRVDVDKIRRWEKLALPLLLIVWHVPTRTLYYADVSTVLDGHKVTTSEGTRQSITIRVPTKNKLDSAGAAAAISMMGPYVDNKTQTTVRDLRAALENVTQCLCGLQHWHACVEGEYQEYRSARDDHVVRTYGEFPSDRYAVSIRHNHRCWDQEEGAMADVLVERLHRFDVQDLEVYVEQAAALAGDLISLQRVLLERHSPSSLWSELANELGTLAIILAQSSSYQPDTGKDDFWFAHAVSEKSGMALRAIREAESRLEQIKWIAIDLLTLGNAN